VAPSLESCPLSAKLLQPLRERGRLGMSLSLGLWDSRLEAFVTRSKPRRTATTDCHDEPSNHSSVR